jgi:nucleoid-associated protein YgaU
MTSDAKVGLLLGLVFIFIIAFLINGLPTFRGSRDNGDMTSIMLTQDKTIGINSEELDYINHVSGFGGQRLEDSEFVMDSIPRYKIPLDGIVDISARQDNTDFNKAVEEIVRDDPRTRENSRPHEATGQAKVPGPRTAVRHTVKANENLSTISLKYYGPKEGNRLVNIKRIFEANRKTLKSMDEVFKGQKLVIPPLKGTVNAAGTGGSSKSVSKSKSILDNPMFEKVVGRIKIPRRTPPKKSRYYTVQDGDNLWRISAKMLKDGKRYKEILKINSKSLPDEHSLTVGMRLKIPSE